jgi:hypothetical protein
MQLNALLVVRLPVVYPALTLFGKPWNSAFLVQEGRSWCILLNSS